MFITITINLGTLSTRPACTWSSDQLEATDSFFI